MATDSISGLTQELEAAMAVLAPQIRGMEDLLRVSLSAAPIADIQRELDDRYRRRTLLQNALAAIEALEAAMLALENDGYPELPKASVAASVFQELKEQHADIEAALAEFEAEPVASAIGINLGTPTDKP